MPLLRRTLAVLVAVMIAVTAFAAPATAATRNPAKAAAGWLARQLTDGERVEVTYKGNPGVFPHHTAEIVLALDAAGVGQKYARKATTWLASSPTLRGYIGDGITYSNVGPLAKITLVAEAQGLDPTGFGGVDLIAELLATQTPVGRFGDRTPYTDNSTNLVHAYALLALHRHGAVPQSAIDYLVASQCADGGFGDTRLGPCVQSDAITTGIAVQALLAVGGHGSEVTEAVDWLESAQGVSGGFGGIWQNAVDTSPAALAFKLTGRTQSAHRAVEYLKSLQVGCSATTDQGGIAYDGHGLSGGPTIEVLDDLNATSQAIHALTGVSLAEVSALDARRRAPILDCSRA